MKKILRSVLALMPLFALLLPQLGLAQDFNAQQVISDSAFSAQSVYAADLDGDGDMDVLSASRNDDKIAWYENQGSSFSAQQIISTNADGAESVYAADLDGDGDMDVLSASSRDDKIAWYENQGGGSFGAQQVITTAADAAQSVYAADLDGDGDMDVLSTSVFGDDKIAWYENQGGGSFGSQQVISTDVDNPGSVYTADLDGDGDADVLSASEDDDKIAWYENQGGGSFGSQQVINQAKEDTDNDGNLWDEEEGNANDVRSVHAADLDGDRDMDVLSASRDDDKIAWYENQGGGSFGAQQVISTDADGARSVYAADLDGDGDMDVLSASSNSDSVSDDKIAWYENQGGGSFGAQQVISTNADAANSVYAADLDGDGDADVLSASLSDDKIAWYENLFDNGGVTALSDSLNAKAFSLYPNPTTGRFALETEESGTVEVITPSGQVLYSKSIKRQSASFNLDLESGLYLLRFTNQNGQQSIRKLMVE